MIGLVTPTGARPDQFRLCSKFMKRQTYSGEVYWAIVDDAVPRSTDFVTQDFRDKWKIIPVHPKPIWAPGMNTQGRNIAAGIQALVNNVPVSEIEAIFIIEDDDYYTPGYLQEMMNHFGNYSLLGETRTIYYNVRFRRYITNGNTGHASLFQTAFKPNVIPVINQCLTHKFIDVALWQAVKDRYLIPNRMLSVGIKGMPGRAGIGAGHGGAMNMHLDINLAHLTKLIGDDAKLYERYYGTGSKPQHLLFTKSSR